MLSADEALRIVVKTVAPLGVERIALLDALGRVLGEEVRSPRDIPGFANSAMDGFAVRAADVASAGETNPVRLKVVETVAAGRMPTKRIGAGEAVRTMTGAPIADGADAIVPVERTRGTNSTVEILAPEEAGAWVRPRGEDVREGESVLCAGRLLRPADIGMLASLNRPMVDVYRRPRVAIVATGDELVDVDQAPSGAQVVNSSGYALAAAVRDCGGEPTLLRIARDEPRIIRERLEEAASFDCVLTTGGVSVGQFDHVKQVLDELGMRTLFHGVAQKPGRPLKFGTLRDRPVFGLPGNPVSTLVCFYLYTRPALLKMSGRHEFGLARIEVRCAVDIRIAPKLTEFVRVRLERRDGAVCATPTGNQGSGILSSVSRADGLLIGPASEEVLKAGSVATVLLLGQSDGEAVFEERRRQSS
jgi:molybdopterin molybdotransferase